MRWQLHPVVSGSQSQSGMPGFCRNPVVGLPLMTQARVSAGVMTRVVLYELYLDVPAVTFAKDDASARIDADAECDEQSEELRQLAALSREAAEILWEMAAMQDAGDAAQEMLEKSTTLQVRLVLNSV